MRVNLARVPKPSMAEAQGFRSEAAVAVCIEFENIVYTCHSFCYVK